MELRRFIRVTADEQNLLLTRKPNGNFYSGFISTVRLGISQKRFKKKKLSHLCPLEGKKPLFRMGNLQLCWGDRGRVHLRDGSANGRGLVSLFTTRILF